MTKKHILVVDDSRDILFLLQLSLKQLGPEWVISTAMDGPSALEILRREKVDLVLTDYMMPGMSGTELAEEIRRLSPDTQVVMMTAYDSSRLREKVAGLQLQGYVGKPFTVPEILRALRKVIRPVEPSLAGQPPTESEPPEAAQNLIFDHLKTLGAKTGALYVLLVDIDGEILEAIGQAPAEKLTRLASFIAANFAAAGEIAGLLNDNASTFKSSYFESQQFNIYAHDVNGNCILTVVFGPAGKPGTVWFYTRQTAEALAGLVDRTPRQQGKNHNSDMVADTFKNILENEARSTDGTSRGSRPC